MYIGPETLINGYLDDQLSEEELRALNDWIRSDPRHARLFALALLQHDRLHDAFRTPAEIVGELPRPVGDRPPRRRLRRASVALAIAAGVMIASLIGLQSIGNRRVDAAEAQLDRLIEMAGRPGDRTYRIAALDGGESQGTVETPPRPPIDGALLYVRSSGQYVLIRRPNTQEMSITGSNGREAWSISSDGPVRISPDPSRFRGAVPGEQQDLPFLDLKSALARLRGSYELTLAMDCPDTNVQVPCRPEAVLLVSRPEGRQHPVRRPDWCGPAVAPGRIASGPRRPTPPGAGIDHPGQPQPRLLRARGSPRTRPAHHPGGSMSGIRTRVTLILAMASWTATGAMAQTRPGAAVPSTRPNFVFILGEGHGWGSTSVPMDDAVPQSKSAFVGTPNLETGVLQSHDSRSWATT